MSNAISGGYPVRNITIEPGQDDSLNRTWGGGMAKTASLNATGMVGVVGPCIYYGVTVTTALSASPITIRDDAATGGSGTIVDIVAASATAGTERARPFGTYCANGLAVNFGGTGTITVHYWQV